MSLTRFATLMLLAAILTASISAETFDQTTTARFPDANMSPIANWTGPVFHLSQEYPTTLPATEDYPWRRIDFKTQPNEYLRAVLKYCVEGNDAVDWDLEKNTVRKWYHAPWLHWGRNGREFIHGLTHERVSQPLELGPLQTSVFQNWAVGMYNAPGGYVLGRVWADPNNPDPSAARFPEGTVSIKLLFTQASTSQVPYLKNSKEWQAYIYETTDVPTNPTAKRVVTTMRLLQVDIAVSDSRSPSGWIFGTFQYNGLAPGNTVWDRMIPVGLMWGNDPDVKGNTLRNFTKLKESLINEADPNLPIEHLGWGGRLNGPVDNTYSSCLSCHSTAQWPVVSALVPTATPPKEIVPDSPEWMRWFRNLKPGEPFDSGAQSLDFSLQLAGGIQNFCEWSGIVASRGGAGGSNTGIPKVCTQPQVFGLDGAAKPRTNQVTRDPEIH